MNINILTLKNILFTLIILFLSPILSSCLTLTAYSLIDDAIKNSKPHDPGKFQWGLIHTDSWGKKTVELREYPRELNGTSYYDFGEDGFWRLQTFSMLVPSKEEAKRRYKNKEFYSYKGVFTYIVSDEYPTAQEVFRHCGLYPPRGSYNDVFKDSYNEYGKPINRVHRVADAVIYVEPYKDHPRIFIVKFDGVEMEFDLGKAKRWDWL